MFVCRIQANGTQRFQCVKSPLASPSINQSHAYCRTQCPKGAWCGCACLYIYLIYIYSIQIIYIYIEKKKERLCINTKSLVKVPLVKIRVGWRVCTTIPSRCHMRCRLDILGMSGNSWILMSDDTNIYVYCMYKIKYIRRKLKDERQKWPNHFRMFVTLLKK